MYTRLLKHTLFGFGGAAYSVGYDVVSTAFSNVFAEQDWQDWQDLPPIEIDGDDIKLYFFTCFIISVFYDLLRNSSNDYCHSRRYEPLQLNVTRANQLAEHKFPAELVPDEFIDNNIGMQVMDDPVILAGDGETYERRDIERWLSTNRVSPAQGYELSLPGDLQLIPNLTKRREIEVFMRNKVFVYVPQVSAESSAEEEATLLKTITVQKM
jgi:hypothetical protein